MPTLKQINCSIELGPSNTKIKEYGARYSDGHVESFIAVPATNIPFSIHLTTEGYIAPGIAFFVFMDGEYQCNRNRQGLKLPGEGVRPEDYEAEFRVRQKEEKTSLGSFVAREWTFAKLNRVEADKAPNLNPQFTNNVGSIEVIVLRCKSDTDTPPPRVLQPRYEDRPPPGKTSKCSAAVAPAASAKASAAPDDMFGGMFGLFDGAFDDINLDGAIDEQSVRSDRSLSPQCRPGTVFDPMSGHWIPASDLEPPTEVKAALDAAKDTKQQIEAVEKNIHEASAQLDGHGGQPGVVINQWGDRARDDMRGDKCLGLEADDREAYKDYLREAGESVSSHAYYRQQGQAPTQQLARQRAQPNPYYQNRQPYQQHPLVAVPLGPDPMNIAQKLQAMRLRFEYLLQTYPGREEDETKRKLSIILRLQRLQQQGHGGFQLFPMWLREYLTDLEVRRQYIIRLQQSHPNMDLSHLLRDFEGMQTNAMVEPTFHKDLKLDEFDEAEEMHMMFAHRVKLLQEFVVKAERFSRLSTHDLRSRINFVSNQRDKAQSVVKNIEQRRARPRAEFEQPQNWRDTPEGAHEADWQAGDGAPRTPQGWASPETREGNNGWFNQVGEGIWKPQQQNQGLDQWAADSAGFGGGQQDGDWLNTEKKDNRGNAGDGRPDADQNYSIANKSNRGRDSKDGNQGWNNAGSQKTHEHDFSQSADRKSRQSDASQSKQSNRQSNDDNGWGGGDDDNNNNNNNHQQSQVDGNNWGGSGGSKKDNNNAWDAGSRKSSRSSSARTAIKVSEYDPTAYIKPYWKDWNKPFSRDVTSDAGAEKVYEEPREVYTYPASALPAVPKKAVKDASYGIQTSRGADYTHKTHRPVYIDTMERPYAVLSFKYRSKEVLEKILRIKVDDSDLKKVQKEAEEARLNVLPKHKLVEELMAKRAPQKSDSKKESSNAGSKSVAGWGDDRKESERGGWGNQGGSNKSASSKSSSKKSNKNDGGWNDAANKNANDDWNNQAKLNSRSGKKDTKDAAPGWDTGSFKSKGDKNQADRWDQAAKQGQNSANGWNQGSNQGSNNPNFGGW